MTSRNQDQRSARRLQKEFPEHSYQKLLIRIRARPEIAQGLWRTAEEAIQAERNEAEKELARLRG